MNGIVFPRCKHHWLINSPDGSLELKAKCKICKEHRTFPAVPEIGSNNQGAVSKFVPTTVYR